MVLAGSVILYEFNSITLLPTQWHPWLVTDWRGGWAREWGWKELDLGRAQISLGRDGSGTRYFRGGSVGDSLKSKSTLLILRDAKGGLFLDNCVSRKGSGDRQLPTASTVGANSADGSRLDVPG